MCKEFENMTIEEIEEELDLHFNSSLEDFLEAFAKRLDSTTRWAMAAVGVSNEDDFDRYIRIKNSIYELEHTEIEK